MSIVLNQEEQAGKKTIPHPIILGFLYGLAVGAMTFVLAMSSIFTNQTVGYLIVFYIFAMYVTPLLLHKRKGVTGFAIGQTIAFVLTAIAFVILYLIVIALAGIGSGA